MRICWPSLNTNTLPLGRLSNCNSLNFLSWTLKVSIHFSLKDKISSLTRRKKQNERSKKWTSMRRASSTRTQSKTSTTTDCRWTTQSLLFRFNTRSSTRYQLKPELTSYFTCARRDSTKKALIIFKKFRISKMRGKRRKTKRQQRLRSVKNSRK